MAVQLDVASAGNLSPAVANHGWVCSMSRPNLLKRVSPLSTAELAIVFDSAMSGHLRYRMTMLRSWRDRIESKGQFP
jgi:hypothetical protein